MYYLKRLCWSDYYWSIHQCAKTGKCYEITLLGVREVEKESWMM